MKQRITVDQLQELTTDQQEILRRWWNPQIGDVCANEYNEEEHVVVDLDKFQKDTEFSLLPLLSIGQCIELLENSGRFKGLHKSDTDGEYKVYIILNDDHGENDYIKSGRQLIDALWEAVKQIL